MSTLSLHQKTDVLVIFHNEAWTDICSIIRAYELMYVYLGNHRQASNENRDSIMRCCGFTCVHHGSMVHNWKQSHRIKADSQGHILTLALLLSGKFVPAAAASWWGSPIPMTAAPFSCCPGAPLVTPWLKSAAMLKWWCKYLQLLIHLVPLVWVSDKWFFQIHGQ